MDSPKSSSVEIDGLTANAIGVLLITRNSASFTAIATAKGESKPKRSM
jgi:hypothetical protein